MHRDQDGYLCVEGLRVAELLARGLPTPFYLYSLSALRGAYDAYAQAAAGLPFPVTIGYAVKANGNPALLRRLVAHSGARAAAVLVSAGEVALARGAGFARMWLHGNGKRREDLEAALQAGAWLSVDSAFDLRHIEEVARALGRPAQLLLRVNPDIDVQVHPYIATGLRDSKFGVAEGDLGPLLQLIAAAPERLQLRGVHSHLGSTLTDLGPFVEGARRVIDLALALRWQGHPVDAVDLGGGLGIDYERRGAALPTAGELLSRVQPLLEGLNLELLLEPGRSLVGGAGVLVGRCIGVKDSGDRRFLVTDASMAQLIRPCLYQAYHHVELASPPADAAPRLCDVVGPVCESADFMAQGRMLPTPAEGEGVVICDAGAYGFVMASRYNQQLLPAEYLVEGARLSCIRRAETLAEVLATAVDEPVW